MPPPIVTYRLFRGWRADDREILPALRKSFAYPRGSDRATGYLWDGAGLLNPPGITWPGPLAALGPDLVRQLRAELGARFTVALFQAYRNGTGCDWHPDADWGAQAILSLGVTRTLGMRRTGQETYAQLAHGDMIYMPDGFGDEWEHCVPREAVRGERCSLVFRAARKN